jgi:hypothetical protein
MNVFSIEARNNVSLKLTKSLLNLTPLQFQKEIKDEFNDFLSKLNQSGLDYNTFKYTLVPPKGKDKDDHVFVFDTSKIKNSSYGYEVFKNIIPCFKRKSKHNVLSGDLLDLSNGQHIDKILTVMFDSLNVPKINEKRYVNRFYLVYINNISKTEINNIIKAMSEKNYFVGSCNMTYSSLFKSYISHCIGTIFVKNGENIIMGHEENIEDNSNVNILGYSFEDNKYNIVSIRGDYFGVFLTYKIGSDMIINQKVLNSDIEIISNTITGCSNNITKLNINLSDDKIKYLSESKKIFDRISIKQTELNKIIKDKIKKSLIYNISFEAEQYNIIKFNIFIDFIEMGVYKKIICSLGYSLLTNELNVITMY